MDRYDCRLALGAFDFGAGRYAFSQRYGGIVDAQSGERNGCAQVMAKEPMHCEGVHDRDGLGQPQFETDQTFVGLVRVKLMNRWLLEILGSDIGSGAGCRRCAFW